MLYIKENDTYYKYYTSDDGRLICSTKNSGESSVLGGVSGEFDALCDKSGNIHFVIQGMDGELIYLIRDGGVWKKYNLFKSKNRLKKIHGLRLFTNGNYLCAFYIMEHRGNKLMVRHRFSPDKLYEEPLVLGIVHKSGNYCICKTGRHFVLFYKNENSSWVKTTLGEDFTPGENKLINFGEEIINIRTIGIADKIYACLLVPKNHGTVLLFCNIDKIENPEIVSFGNAPACVPQLIYSDGRLHIQWEEGLAVIECYSDNMGESFSKPLPIKSPCKMAKLRIGGKEDEIFSDKCAIYNFDICINKNNVSKNPKRSCENPMNSKNVFGNSNTEVSYITEKLKGIETSVDEMGKRLLEICSFLDNLKEYKKSINDEVSITANSVNERDNEEKNDMNSINTENIKLFENTDIDSVLPEA